MKYQVWTVRALLAWAPAMLLLLGASAYVSMAVPVQPHVHIVNAVAALAVIGIVLARHRMHARIRDSITDYLLDGTRLVVRIPDGWSALQSDAIERGLREALERCCERFPTREDRMRAALSKSFVIVQDEVFAHVRREKVKVGGLTYFGGPMVLTFTYDLYWLEDLACHEAVHACLNSIGAGDSYGTHHSVYEDLFVPVVREGGK